RSPLVAECSPARRTVGSMRDQYYEQLDRIVEDLVSLTTTVRRAVAESTTALLDADTTIPERVIDGGRDVDELIDEVEERAFVVLATQQPVASDLRQVVAALRMLADLQRMNALAVHVSKVARRRMPESAVPLAVQPTIRSMASVADSMIDQASRIVANRDVNAAARLELEDDTMDRLRTELFRIVLDDSWDHGLEPAIDLA
ncbi:PhoU family transcriptional regulator, partial [Priestia megaterium]